MKKFKIITLLIMLSQFFPSILLAETSMSKEGQYIFNSLEHSDVEYKLQIYKTLYIL